ncbi:MAG: AmmeMemoRadiSam system protein B [Verrucomicrobia bacterium]|nr:AmmeMemoRadiSam system protein B [Verrucomicrobiota bacterium]
MENPKLRPVEAFPVRHDGRQMIMLRDPLRWTENILFVPAGLLPILQRLDGTNSVLDIQAEIMRRSGQLVPGDFLRGIVAKLDEGLMLDSPRFHQHRERLVREFRQSPVRPAANAGTSYPAEPEKITAMFNSHFLAADGPNAAQGRNQSGLGFSPSPLAGAWTGVQTTLPQPPANNLCARTRPVPTEHADGPASRDATRRQIVGLIAPHIDFRRGGVSFAWAYQQLRGRDEIELFVILGTGHQPMKQRFGGIRKDYATPLGVARTDHKAMQELAAGLPFDFFEDEWAHRTEHSIEFQVVYLQHLFGGKLNARILPVLAGSFQEFGETGASPAADAEVAAFTKALRQLVDAHRGKVCVIAGVDFAHIGGRFGDNEPMDEARRARLEREDRAMLDAILSCDAEAFHRNIAADQDARRVCGYPAIYTLLAALRPSCARLLHYAQSHETETNSVVSFGSVAFYA